MGSAVTHRRIVPTWLTMPYTQGDAPTVFAISKSQPASILEGVACVGELFLTQRAVELEKRVRSLEREISDLRRTIEHLASDEVLRLREISDDVAYVEMSAYIKKHGTADEAEIWRDVNIPFEQIERVCERLLKEGKIRPHER